MGLSRRMFSQEFKRAAVDRWNSIRRGGACAGGEPDAEQLLRAVTPVELREGSRDCPLPLMEARATQIHRWIQSHSRQCEYAQTIAFW